MERGLLISGERQLSRAQMFQRAGQASTGFDQIGVGESDAVAIMLRNDFPFFEATFAAGRLGAYALPINWHYVADEVGHILQDSDAKVLLIHADLLPQIDGAIPPDVTVLVVETPEEISYPSSSWPKLTATLSPAIFQRPVTCESHSLRIPGRSQSAERLLMLGHRVPQRRSESSSTATW